ncbi:hypothetical protein KIPB_009626 [Kipferlia bialata]|uniref:Uncharacterized protein n=1 Tax=Kipferlia bialata TaxID=797122 RepID=A0A9K3D445_9EUKA|nr:hypothetical protein KIPB_009626 [Kipferlia bialata]|eukprot:g9626.t1
MTHTQSVYDRAMVLRREGNSLRRVQAVLKEEQLGNVCLATLSKWTRSGFQFKPRRSSLKLTNEIIDYAKELREHTDLHLTLKDIAQKVGVRFQVEISVSSLSRSFSGVPGARLELESGMDIDRISEHLAALSHHSHNVTSQPIIPPSVSMGHSGVGSVGVGGVGGVGGVMGHTHMQQDVGMHSMPHAPMPPHHVNEDMSMGMRSMGQGMTQSMGQGQGGGMQSMQSLQSMGGMQGMHQGDMQSDMQSGMQSDMQSTRQALQQMQAGMQGTTMQHSGMQQSTMQSMQPHHTTHGAHGAHMGMGGDGGMGQMQMMDSDHHQSMSNGMSSGMQSSGIQSTMQSSGMHGAQSMSMQYGQHQMDYQPPMEHTQHTQVHGYATQTAASQSYAPPPAQSYGTQGYSHPTLPAVANTASGINTNGLSSMSSAHTTHSTSTLNSATSSRRGTPKQSRKRHSTHSTHSSNHPSPAPPPPC